MKGKVILGVRDFAADDVTVEYKRDNFYYIPNSQFEQTR
jgi:hypothetical protein